MKQYEFYKDYKDYITDKFLGALAIEHTGFYYRPCCAKSRVILRENGIRDVGQFLVGNNNEIKSIYILEACRGRGIGKVICKHLLRYYKGYYVTCYNNNEVAMKMYKQFFLIAKEEGCITTFII